MRYCYTWERSFKSIAFIFYRNFTVVLPILVEVLQCGLTTKLCYYFVLWKKDQCPPSLKNLALYVVEQAAWELSAKHLAQFRPHSSLHYFQSTIYPTNSVAGNCNKNTIYFLNKTVIALKLALRKSVVLNLHLMRSTYYSEPCFTASVEACLFRSAIRFCAIDF